MREIHVSIALWWVLAYSTANAVTIGIVTDGPTQRQASKLDLVQHEVSNLLGDEFDVSFPVEKRRHGNWTLDGVRQALNQTLADDEIDVVITLGLLASNEVARIERLRKPVIAAVVPDGVLQGFPFSNGVSGRRNFTYISSFSGIGDEVQTFHEIVGFKHLTIIADQVSLGAIPEFRDKSNELARNLGFTIDVLAIDGPVVDHIPIEQHN